MCKVFEPTAEQLAEIAVLNTPIRILLETVDKHFPTAKHIDWNVQNIYQSVLTSILSSEPEQDA